MQDTLEELHLRFCQPAPLEILAEVLHRKDPQPLRTLDITGIGVNATLKDEEALKEKIQRGSTLSTVQSLILNKTNLSVQGNVHIGCR